MNLLLGTRRHSSNLSRKIAAVNYKNVASANQDQSARRQDLQARYRDGGMSQKSIFSVERTASKHRASSGTSVSRGRTSPEKHISRDRPLISPKHFIAESFVLK